MFEPPFGVAETRAKAGDFTPEPAGVVHLPEVGELMQDEVVANKAGGLHEAPVEGDGAAPGAGAPAGTLVPDRDAPERELMKGGEFEDARGQFPNR